MPNKEKLLSALESSKDRYVEFLREELDYLITLVKKDIDQ